MNSDVRDNLLEV